MHLILEVWWYAQRFQHLARSVAIQWLQVCYTMMKNKIHLMAKQTYNSLNYMQWLYAETISHTSCIPRMVIVIITQIAKFMGPTWAPTWVLQPQMGPMLDSWTLLSGKMGNIIQLNAIVTQPNDHDIIHHTAISVAEHKSSYFNLTTETPYLVLVGELWGGGFVRKLTLLE